MLPVAAVEAPWSGQRVVLADAAARVACLAGHDPDSLVRVLRGLPPSLSSAVVIACTGSDLELPGASGLGLPVELVRVRARLVRGRVYLVPQSHDAILAGTEIVLQPLEHAQGRVDRLMRSAAQQHGRETVGVLLGGPGSDGTLGLKAIKEAGGLTIVQSDADSEMTRTALATGLVDVALSLAELESRLAALLDALDDRTPPMGGIAPPESPADTLRDILTLVRVRTGHDFSAYKRGTLSRRVSRRMLVCGTQTLPSYHQHLREHPTELVHLQRDFLISVTSFFRDPDAYATLAETVLPRIFSECTATDQVRVWAPGCATGEEAYSLAMLLAERAATMACPPAIQVFATDVDDRALAQARAGRYPASIAADVSPERLERFFTRDGSSYQVSSELRDLVLLSSHDLLRDPPFSRLDLVSCRNVLIYLNREAQERLLAMFHFGLRSGGYLWLGSSESAENASMFSALDGRARIFERRSSLRPVPFENLVPRRHPPPTAPVAGPGERLPPIGELHRRLVALYGPPSVLVDDALDVLHVSEHAGRFLQVTGGEPTRQLLRLALPPLRVELRSAISNARRSGRGSDTRTVEFVDNGGVRRVELRVHARLPEGTHGSVLVLFAELSPSEPLTVANRGDDSVPQLADELHRTREQLRHTIEQYETSLEELEASNEELLSINEELRSASEELETSKQELQSVNEELTTLNHELRLKVEEALHASSDLQNLLSSTDIAVLFLDRNLHVKRFTPHAQSLFHVIPSDLGRPLAHVTHRLLSDELPQLASRVLADTRIIEREIPGRDGRRYLARVLPYRSLEDRVDGVVLTFIDVTVQRAAADAHARCELTLRSTQERLQLALRVAPLAIVSFDHELRVRWAYAMGRELALDENALALFAPDQVQLLLSIVRDVNLSRHGQRVELDLVGASGRRTFEFRIEPADGGTLAIGCDITPS